MSIVILGAGALGSVLGAGFADAGADVTLVGRSAHIEAIRADGLQVDGVRGRRVSRGLKATADPCDVKAANVLMLCTKSYDTREALASVAYLRGRVGAALSLQNGARKDEELAEAFGREAVLGAATLVGGAIMGPGWVRHTNDGSTWLGEFDGRRTPRVEAIAELFRTAAFPVEIVPDIRSTTWCKLNQMVPAALLACLTRLPIHRIYLEDDLARLFVELSREVAAIAPRLGLELVDLPGSNVKSVCTLPFDAAVDAIKARGRAMQRRGMTEVKISTLQDLERGKRTESEQVIGHVVRLAAQHGVAVPRLELCYRILRGVESCADAAGARAA